MEFFTTEDECKKYTESISHEPNFENNKIMLFPPVTDLESLRLNLDNAGASEDVKKCVEFVFKRYRSAIYVAFVNGLFYYLVFINTETPNEYGEYMELDPVLERKIPKMITDINEYFRKSHIDTTFTIKDKKDWYVSGFLAAIEEYITKTPQFSSHYLYETYMFLLRLLSDSDLSEFLVNKRLDFIVNYRDQNLIRADNTDPFFHVVNPPRTTNIKFEQPFSSADFMNICPVLSFGGHVDYLDIMIPSTDDISRVMKLYSPDKCKPLYRDLWAGEETPLPDWNNRIPKAVFRGTTTGWGLNVRTNPRMKISSLSLKYPDLIDAGITRFSNRFKKVYNERYIKMNDDRPLKKSNFLSYVEQAGYKYQVVIEGNIAAFRMGAAFGSGSLVLIVKSDYKLWFEPLLRENYHYISVESDLSNLLGVISWCQQNDAICQQIALNGKKFYDDFLGDKIFDYTKIILKKIAKPIS